MSGTLLSIGHGYSARALGQRLIADGWRVIGTTRSAEKARALAAEGVESIIWPGQSLPLREATHLLTSVSPDETGTDPLLAEATAALGGADMSWVGYLSTTAVYGDHGGGWVDEDTPVAPATARGKARVLAETAWRETGLPLHIFRLAGIYGPGRSALDKVRDGTARRIVKPGQVFSRIHVDDIAAILHASMLRPAPVRVYNVCDDEPAPPQDVIAFAADLLGVQVPEKVPFDEADLSPMARSFYAESKRVRNDRIKGELGVSLRYPTYREGLGAILAAERAG